MSGRSEDRRGPKLDAGATAESARYGMRSALSLRQWAARRAPYRGGLKAELVMALVPTGIILAILLGLNTFAQQHILFASLASSAFLIYRDPRNSMNQVGVMVPSHIIALTVGYVVSLIFGATYVSAAVAMGTTILIIVVLRVIHPPAVSTSLIFAFRQHNAQTLGLFILALVMLVALVIIQRAAVYLLGRFNPLA